MSGRSEFFVAFGLAVGLHVAGLGAFAANGGFEGAGSEGLATLSLQAAPEGVAELVATWEAVPEIADATEAPVAPAGEADFAKVDHWSDASLARPSSKLSDAPERVDAPDVHIGDGPTLARVSVPPAPKLVAPKATDVSRAQPSAMPPVPSALATFDAPQMVDRAVVASVRPAQRPQRSDPVPALVARGTGGGVSAGALAATKAVVTQSPAARRAAETAWAGQIQRRIARQQTYPRGARGQGRVRLQMDILADGRLSAVRIDRSSGVAAFDKAALRAARAAAPFPAAPSGLKRDRYAFAQWVNFSR